jgi:hypothetical protein
MVTPGPTGAAQLAEPTTTPEFAPLPRVGGQYHGSTYGGGACGSPTVAATVAAPSPQTAVSSIAGSSLASVPNRPGSGSTLRPAFTTKL